MEIKRDSYLERLISHKGNQRVKIVTGIRDTYVTGSNSKFLSKDIVTEFRGRGDEMYLRPLSFREYHATCDEKSFDDAWKEYLRYENVSDVV